MKNPPPPKKNRNTAIRNQNIMNTVGRQEKLRTALMDSVKKSTALSFSMV